MNTAQEFARFAVEVRQMAERIKTTTDDPLYNARTLVQFNLNTAARNTQEIAEALAKQENLK